jgi:CMP-N-acetylneuraminic acid synthetase
MIAIIPARGGSKGIPKKNIVKLRGHPLIAYAIVNGIKAGFKVYVSTDDNDIARVANKYGAIPFVRPSEFAQDHSGDLEVFRHAVDVLNLPRSEDIVHLRATTPMLDPEVLKDAVKQFPTRYYTSLRSAHEMPESAYKCFTIKQPNYQYHRIGSEEFHSKPRQEVPKTYKPNGYIDIVRPSWFMENQTLHGPMIRPFITPVAPEVDTIEELEYIEWLMKKNGYRI